MEQGRKQCFFIAPIGAPGSDVRKHSDAVLAEVVRPALEPAYEVTRGDQISEMGQIVAQVLQRVVHDPLVVADLSYGNPNVFYELAIRHVFRRPVIQIRRQGEEEVHNVRGMRTVDYDLETPESVEAAIQQIHLQAEGAETATTIDTPAHFEDPEMVEALAGVIRLLQPERAEGPSVADLTSIRDEVRRVAGEPSEAKRRQRLHTLRSSLDTMIHFYG